MTRRVLWLIKGLGRGGAERLATTCIPHVDGSRYTVEVAYLMPNKAAYVDRLVAHGIGVHCLHGARELDLAWVRRLHELLRDGNYSVLHTHSPVPAVAARLVKGRTRLVHTEHGVWTRYRTPTYWANALTYARNDAVIAVSQAVADTVRRRYLSPRLRQHGLDVVLHGIELGDREQHDARRAARAALGLPTDALVIGTVGNLTGMKNHRMLVDAFRDLRPAFPAARLCIIGSGPLEEQLGRWIHDAGLDDVVLLAGSRDDAQELMAGFDIFALTSQYDGLSIALLEAMAAGVPSVATRVGGIPEVLDGTDAGIMVRSGDRAAFTAALSSMLADEGRRTVMGRSAVHRAKAFDVRRCAREIENIYDRVLAS